MSERRHRRRADTAELVAIAETAALLPPLREHFLPRFKEMKPELAKLVQLGDPRGNVRR